MNDPFEKLHEQLTQQEWPNVYLFKFIMPNTAEHMARVMALFGDLTEIAFQESKTGKYISVTAKEVMLSADDIIAIYRSAAEIKGVITL